MYTPIGWSVGCGLVLWDRVGVPSDPCTEQRITSRQMNRVVQFEHAARSASAVRRVLLELLVWILECTPNTSLLERV